MPEITCVSFCLSVSSLLASSEAKPEEFVKKHTAYFSITEISLGWESAFLLLGVPGVLST